ncbi:MAG: ASPIC/UnbV domain-containing protein, partial [Vicinamibacterales bacterium]
HEPRPNVHALHVKVVDEDGRSTLAGAEVSVFINGTQISLAKRLVDAGSGYNTQNEAPVHFALSEVSQVYLQARIRRPGAERVQTTSVAIDLAKWRNRIYELRLTR